MKKFKDAFNGLKEGLKHRAIAIQFVLGVLAVIGGFIIKLDTNEWLAFIICIGVVIVSEIFNTCIEKICDFVEPEKNDKIRTIKDLAAGGVLCASIMALIVCIYITINKLGGLR